MPSTAEILEARKRPQDQQREEEDAARLHFGKEFDCTKPDGDGNTVIALNNSETRLLINAALAQRHRDQGEIKREDDEEEDFSLNNEVLRKTQEYLSIFARFKDEQTISAVEHLLKAPENADLHPFEVAQLANLLCDDAEEAISLIPSLQYKKSEEDLQVLLDHLRRFG